MRGIWWWKDIRGDEGFKRLDGSEMVKGEEWFGVGFVRGNQSKVG